MPDLNTFSATDAEHFFHTYYVPSNMVVTVVGDIDPTVAMPIIEKYFARLPGTPKPEDLSTPEPPQNSQRNVVLQDPSQPVFLEGYHRPDYRDPDDAVYDAIADVMSNGRTSRLYRALVRDKKIASFAGGFSGLPGNKYPHLFAFFGFPLPGHTPQEIETAIHAEIERLRTQDISDEELNMIKTRAKANLIRGLADNQGLALQLGTIVARYGDWRELFREVDRIEKVSKADIRRVANKTFVPTNRTVGIIETMKPAAAAAASQGGAQ
jgi:predicted Zn-dependent peptidase